MRRDAVAALLVAACVTVVAAAPARGVVLSEDPLEDSSTVLGAILRSFGFAFSGKVLAPPFNSEDANPAAAALFDTRLYFEHKTQSLKFVVHQAFLGGVRSHASLGLLGLGRGVPPPRWLPLRFSAADDPTVSLTTVTDWLYAAYTRGPLTVTLGRQPVTFGQAKIWRPTDLVATFSLTEVNTDYKPGADALRLDYVRSDKLSLTLVAAIGELESDHDFDASIHGSSVLGQLKYDWSDTELSLIGGMVRGDALAGVTVVRDIGGFNTYAEATATLITGKSLPALDAERGDVLARAAVGATWRKGKLNVTPELLWNGFGSFDRADYLALATSTRVAIGEQITLGRAYAGVVADWELHPLMHLSGIGLVNVRDPSALVSAAFSYNIANNTSAVLGAYVPVGKRPSLATGIDVRSEYGLFPVFVFLHVKAVI